MAFAAATIVFARLRHRQPDWEVDIEHAVQAHTPTVRGWESLPVFTP